jgi:hypothetical protein
VQRFAIIAISSFSMDKKIMPGIYGCLCIVTYLHNIFIDDQGTAVGIGGADLFFFGVVQLLLQVIIFYFSLR